MSQERPIRLQSGPWSLEFERWSGWVRCIRLNGIEVVRAVYAAVRSENWATYSQRVTANHILQKENGFEVTWTIEVEELGFAWEGRAAASGHALEVEWIGLPTEDFRTRRTGVCLLHPQELRGKTCLISHSNGEISEGSFPQFIEPHQPFFDIQAIQHQVGDDQLKIEFHGEVFEMEDQRNWTDASFKTYCRPQGWEQPYVVNSEDKIQQLVRFTSTGPRDGWTPQCRTYLTRTESTIPWPKIGTVSSSPVEDFDFVLDPKKPAGWASAGFGRIFAQGSQFADLNRNRPDMSEWDGIAFPATPQVHAFDERSIMENVFGLKDAVITAKLIAGDEFVGVGPIRFRPDHLGRDSRIDRETGPAWFLACVLTLAEAGADAVCILEGSDFIGAMRQALRQIRAGSHFRPLGSSDSYRAIGFEFGEFSAVLINMRPYLTAVHYEEDLELEPYEIRVIE